MVAGQPVAQADLMRKEAWVREAAGRFSDAVRWHRRGLAVLEGIDAPGVAEARAEHLVGIASMRHAQGRFEESISWCHRAIEEAEAAGSRRVVAHAAYLLDWLYDELGKPEEAPYPGLALTIYEELDDLSGQANVLNNLGMFAYFRGEWDEAIDLYERSRRARLELGDEINGAYGTANVAEILLDQGQLDEAGSRFRDALRVWRASGYRQGVAFAVVNLGKIASRQGRFDEAVRLLEEAKKGFEEVGFSSYVLDADARLAENDVFRGHPEAATERAEAAMRRAESMGGMPVLAAVLHRVRAYARLQLADVAGAEEDAATSVQLARERNARFEVALGLEALARAWEATGTPIDADTASERDDILRALGVTAIPEIPLPSLA
jgi:tetratricopeptide (TPR) repeat protein